MWQYCVGHQLWAEYPEDVQQRIRDAVREGPGLCLYPPLSCHMDDDRPPYIPVDFFVSYFVTADCFLKPRTQCATVALADGTVVDLCGGLLASFKYLKSGL